jgi:hypothetical protein
VPLPSVAEEPVALPKPCIVCGVPAKGGRCSAHPARPNYGNQERLRRQEHVRNWVSLLGWYCPGYGREGHESTDLTADHVNIAKTVNVARYKQIGKTVLAVFRVSMTAAGVAGNNITSNLPVTALSGMAVSGSVGAGAIVDTSANTVYAATVFLTSTTSVVWVDTNASNNAVGTTPSFALASGDVISASIMYEAA